MTECKKSAVVGGALTWRDYLPPGMPLPALITRAELLAACVGQGVSLTERTLRYWEAEGVLPRPVRQLHGATVQAVYPSWFYRVVQAAWEWRQAGRSLTEIAAAMPQVINGLVVLYALWAYSVRNVGETPFAGRLVPVLEDMVRDVATHERPVGRVAIVFYGEDGEVLQSHFWPSPLGRLSDGGPAHEATASLLSVGREEPPAFDSD